MQHYDVVDGLMRSPGEYCRKLRRLHPPQEDRDFAVIVIQGDVGLHAFHGEIFLLDMCTVVYVVL